MSPVDNRQVNATFTQLIPVSELAPGEASSIRNQFIKKLVEIAASEMKKQLSDIVVRDLRPKSDLDYTYEQWTESTGATGDAYETMSTGTNGADMWIGIFGVKVEENCPVTMLKFNIGNGERAIWELESLKAEDDFVGFSPAGVVISPNSPYTISRYVRTINAAHTIVLKGVVVEARGKVISP